MTDEIEDNGDVEDAAIGSALSVITDGATGISIPKPVKRGFWKAAGRLVTAAVEVPVAHLEAKSGQIRADAAARKKLTDTASEALANKIGVSPEFARLAVQKEFQRIVLERKNLNAIVREAAKILENEEVSADEEIEPPVEEFLSQFEREAAPKSTEEMKQMFAKILAGEIRRPGSFSAMTLRRVGELEANAADLFENFCSHCTRSLDADGSVKHARMIVPDGSAGTDGLARYGFSFDQLTLLQEHGLLSVTLGTLEPLIEYIGNDKFFELNGKVFSIIPAHGRSPELEREVVGVGLSRVGLELLQITEQQSIDSYYNALSIYFREIGVKVMVR